MSQITEEQDSTLTSQQRRRRKEKERWKRLLIWFLIQKFSRERAEAEARISAGKPIPELLVFLAANSDSIRQSVDPNVLDLLAVLVPLEDAESPFSELYRALNEEPENDKRITESAERCIREVPAQMLRRTDMEERAKSIGALSPQEIDEQEQRFQTEMAVLRVFMPPELFHQLCAEMERKGRIYDPHRRFLRNPGNHPYQNRRGRQNPEPDQTVEKHPLPVQENHVEIETIPGDSAYRNYVEQAKRDPKEKDGQLANAGDIYTAAAYTLAAYEQRDEPVFDPVKADTRAMELSGSRAFRAYMNGHPGSLVAAARNTAVQQTYEGMMALEADLQRRDAVLADARDAMRRSSSGKTALYHRLLNTLDRFINADTEPTKQERDELTIGLASYIQQDCAPGSGEFSAKGFHHAMRAIRALTTEDTFQHYVEKLHQKGYGDIKVSNFPMEPEQVTREENPQEPEIIRQAERM